MLRRALVVLVALRGEDEVLGRQAVDLARRWLEDPKAIDPDMLVPALRAAARNGDRALFDRFVHEARTTADRFRRTRLLTAIGSSIDATATDDAELRREARRTCESDGPYQPRRE